MEGMSRDVETGERAKYQPKYMVFLGRHAEPAKGSIFDQVGGEAGIKSGNFEESSLTLKGIMDSSMLNYDLLSQIMQRMPQEKIRFIFAHTKAYRTQETADLIREKLTKEAQRLGKQIEIEFGDPEKDDFLTETRDEDPQKSADDINQFIDKARKESLFGDGVVLFGITHEAKLRNFLNQSGIPTDNIRTSELLTVTDSGEGRDKVAFRQATVEIPFTQKG